MIYACNAVWGMLKCELRNSRTDKGVPPRRAPTLRGKGWYLDYHTIQNKSAIHARIIIR